MKQNRQGSTRTSGAFHALTVKTGMLMCSTAIAAAPFALGQEAPETLSDEQVVMSTVTVSAQRRDQSLIDVPLSVSVFGGEEIERGGVTRFSDLVTTVPNFKFDQSADARNVRLSIRGVSADTRFPGAEASVAVVIDDVYLSGIAGTLFDLTDIERVEVLRGPQGTLFGRNATGGVINVVSRDPGDEFRGNYSLELGDFNRVVAKGVLAGPIVPGQLNGSVGVSHTQHDGYYDNITTGEDLGNQDTTTVRGLLHWMPSDALDVRITGDYTDESRLFTPVDGNDGDPFDRRVDFDRDPQSDREIYGGSVRAEYSFTNGLRLKSISSYREYEVDEDTDIDGSAADLGRRQNFETNDEFTQEIQLLSPGDGRWNWIVGAFYLNQNFANNGRYDINADGFLPNYRFLIENVVAPNIPGFDSAAFFDQTCVLDAPLCLGVQPTDITWTLDTEAIAAFGEVSYDVNDKLNLSLGARVSNDKRDFGYDSDVFSGFPLLSTIIAVFENTDSRDETNLSWKATANYTFNEQSSVYGSIATGYKAGTFFANILSDEALFDLTEVENETSTNYEVGFKSFFSNGAQLSGATFFIDYQDYQVSQLIPNPILPGDTEILGNADAEMYGAELEFTYPLNEYVDLSGGIGYLNAEFTDYEGCSSGGTDAFGVPLPPIDCDGNTVTYAPEWSGSLRSNLTYPLSNGLELIGDLGWTYQGEQTFSVLNSPGAEEDGYSVVDLSLGVQSADGLWRLQAWGRNIFDEEYATFINDSGVSPTGFVTALGTPATYGVRLSGAF